MLELFELQSEEGPCRHSPAPRRARGSGLNEQLQEALNSRVLIEQAKGVIAERAGPNMEQAFAALRTRARNQNLRLGDVARGVLKGTELLTSELVANVVRHADTDVTVTVRVGPPFRVEVHDGVAATDAFRAMVAEPPPTADVSSIRGRGLGIVHTLATRIGLDDDPDGGKVVWFEL